LWRNGSAADF